jgi:anti-sigma B factor antagonist
MLFQEAALRFPTGVFPMSENARTRLLLEVVDGVTVVSFADTKIVAEDQIQEVGDELYALVEDGVKKRIVLNFGNVQYCSSTVLGKLVSLKRRVEAAKGKLKLCCIHPDLLVPFKLTGLDKVFEIYPEEQMALDKF